MARRAKGEGSLFQLSNGKWRAVVEYPPTPDGKRKRVTRTRPSKVAASVAMRKVLLEMPSGPVCQKYMHEFLTDWLRNGKWSPNTREQYRNAVEKHIVPVLGAIRLDELRPLHVDRWLSDMRCGQRTRQVAYDVLRLALRYAHDMEMIDRNPISKVQRPQYRREEINPFSPAEVEQLLSATRGTRFHAVLLVGLTCGLRQGEMFGLRWSDVDLRAKTITIREQAVEVAGKVVLRPPKTDSSIRTVKMPFETMRALARHRRSLNLAPGPSLVFPNLHGEPQRRGSFRVHFWDPLLASLNLDHRGAHHLRHTFATLALGVGISPHIVSKFLGHTQVSTTLDIYAKAIPSQMSEAADAIQSLYSSLKG